MLYKETMGRDYMKKEKYITREEILENIATLLRKIDGSEEQIREYIETIKKKPYIELSLIAATLKGLLSKTICHGKA